MLTAAARSICPPTAAGFATPPGLAGGFATPGRGAVGIGGFPPATGGLGAPGLLAKGGGVGLGLFATGGGGGLPARELPGREAAGVLALEPFAVVAGDFFHGVADPFDGAIPGNTATGFAEASAVTGLATIFGAAGAPGGRGAAGGGGGGGGAAAGLALGLGGTSSK